MPVGSSSMAVVSFFESVQVTGCCFRPGSTLAVFRLSTACWCLAGAEVLAALSDLSGELSKETGSILGLHCNNLSLATSYAEVPVSCLEYTVIVSPEPLAYQSSCMS